MAKTRQRTQRTQHAALRVPYAEAQRLRERLLSSDVETLSMRDITTIIAILNDVYPPHRPPSRSVRRHPLLLGIGIGLLLVIGIALVW